MISAMFQVSFIEMPGHGVFLAAEEHQRLWYNVLTEKTKEIAEVRAGTILDWGGIAEAGLSLHDLKRRYSSTASARCLDKLNPTLERLQGFSAIINGLVQCGPSFTSLVNTQITVCSNCLFTQQADMGSSPHRH